MTACSSTACSERNPICYFKKKQAGDTECPRLVGVTWRTLTCREKARSAGMGISAAMKKAVTLLMEVSATLAPVRLRHSPVLS